MGIYASESHDVLSAIIKKRAVQLEDVLVLRRQVWPDGAISRSEAEMLFRINDAIEATCAEWDDFFVEAMTTFLVEQAHPEGFVSEENAAWFEGLILRDGKLCGPTELETLVTILQRAKHVPHRLEMLALEAVRDAVLSGDKVMVANGMLRKDIIGDPEVALLRRILYTSAGARGEEISIDEAELIFDLNDKTAATTNCPAWMTLYVNVLANYLLTQNDFVAPSRTRLREIDTWLNRSTAGVNGFAEAVARRQMHVVRSGGLFADIKAAFGELSPLEEVYEQQSGQDARSDGGRVDSDEARWLIDRLCRDGELTLNERALLVFLNTGGYAIDPTLDELIALAE